MIKPRAKAIPIVAIPFDLFSRVVTSPTTAVAVEIFPPMIPPMNLAKIRTVKDPLKNQSR